MDAQYPKDPRAAEVTPASADRTPASDRVGVIVSWCIIVVTASGVVVANVQRSAAKEAAANRVVQSSAGPSAASQPATTRAADAAPEQSQTQNRSPTPPIVPDPLAPDPITAPAGPGPDRSDRSEGPPEKAVTLQFQWAAKLVIGQRQIAAGSNLAAPDAEVSIQQLRDTQQGWVDRVALVPLLAELKNAKAAQDEIDRLRQQPSIEAAGRADLKTFSQLYASGVQSLSAGDRHRLIERYRWIGRLALSHGLEWADPRRASVFQSATTLMYQLMGFLGMLLLAGVVGLGLLVLAFARLAQRRLRLRYSESRPDSLLESQSAWNSAPPPVAFPVPHLGVGELPPPWFSYLDPLQRAAIAAPQTVRPGTLRPLGAAQGRTAPFLEAFAVYLGGMGLISVGFRYVLQTQPSPWWSLAMLPPLLLAFAWPRLRGITGPAYRRGLGWTAPQGVLKELGWGLIGYVAGLPVMGLFLAVSLLLTKLADAHPSHPIDEGLAGGTFAILATYLLAAVYAPIVEETFFRGALFHHLRRRHGWILSALVSSLVFASLHPQGWTVFPALASFGVVTCGIREWRGSTLGGMAAHCLNNATVVTIMILAMR